MSSPQVDPEAPLFLDDFELVKALGNGAAGTVYEAVQRSLGKRVAVKMLNEAYFTHAEMVQRFLREARAVARLRHRHIVGVHGIGRTPRGGYFIVMDLIEGSNLQDRISEGRLPPLDAAVILRALAEAAHHAHERGIIHRDLKPSNVLLEDGSVPRLTDFGLAKYVPVTDSAADAETATTVSLPGQIIGTPLFMAPEQADSNISLVGPQTDVYGLGGVLYVMLTGRSPIEFISIGDLLQKLRSPARVTSPSEVFPDIPPVLSSICTRCLEKLPEGRYDSAAAVASALDVWIEQETKRKDEETGGTQLIDLPEVTQAVDEVVTPEVGSKLRELRPRLVMVTPGSREIVSVHRVPYVFGRRDKVDCAIEDPTISTEHARLLFDGSELRLEDLGSKNGTFVGGNRLEPRVPRVVRSGDLVRFAKSGAILITGNATEATDYKRLEESACEILCQRGRLTARERLSASKAAAGGSYLSEAVLTSTTVDLDDWVGALRDAAKVRVRRKLAWASALVFASALVAGLLWYCFR